MKKTSLMVILLWSVLSSLATFAQTGPFSPENWPVTANSNKKVHFITADGSLTAPTGNWLADELEILNSGDQTTAPITIGGHKGLKVTNNYLNVADHSFGEWAEKDTIDILVQVYGNAAVLSATGQPRNFSFLTGTLPEIASPNGGQIPVEGKNNQWNWVLFRIPNGTRPSDGSRLVGSIPADAGAGSQYGGVNGGTIRFQMVPNLIVRVVAFGEEGAFGEPEAINLFAAAGTCDPEPNTNLVGIDFNAGTTNHLSVLNDQDQTVNYLNDVGPAGDKRRAVQTKGAYLNFAITDDYLGKPCNDPRAMKVCLDFYDDPAFAGADVHFGPESYATDDKGGVATYPSSQLYALTGSGLWIRRSWVVPSVALKGVNTGTLTGGPRFISQNGQVTVSRFQLAVLRTGNHPLAGQDPLSDCYKDPTICTDAYGNYAELDLGKDIKRGLDLGTSGGDQTFVVEEAGPAKDRRQAVRPDNPAGYVNFAITDNVFGPSTQDNAHLAVCVTYYDDPALIGARFKPEVYQTEVYGVTVIGGTPDSFYVTLEGSDQWRTAYWELPDVQFSGVNQGPQAAARFILSDKIYITQLRYGVIRPCGAKANVNPVADCRPADAPKLAAAWAADKKLRITWPKALDGFTLQATTSLSSPQWAAANVVPTVEGELNTVVLVPATTTFYRLAK